MGSILRISDALPSALATLLVQVTVVLLAALAVHVAAGRTPPARHALLLGALVTVGLCPLLPLATAALDIAPIIPVSLGSQSNVSPLRQDALASRMDGLSLTAGATRHQGAAGGPSIVDALFVIWLAGTLLALSRLACGVKITRRIRSSALPIDNRMVEKLLPRLAGCLGRVPPPILVSDQIDVPMAVGCLRPTIVLPAKLANGLDQQQLLQVLIHESAHALRRDVAVGFYQRLLAAVIWFHPLVHLANRLLDRARKSFATTGCYGRRPPRNTRELWRLSLSRSLESPAGSLLSRC